MKYKVKVHLVGPEAYARRWSHRPYAVRVLELVAGIIDAEGTEHNLHNIHKLFEELIGQPVHRRHQQRFGTRPVQAWKRNKSGKVPAKQDFNLWIDWRTTPQGYQFWDQIFGLIEIQVWEVGEVDEHK